MPPEVHYCAHKGCGDFACWGYKAGKITVWYCGTHRKGYEQSLNRPLPELKAAQGSLL